MGPQTRRAALLADVVMHILVLSRACFDAQTVQVDVPRGGGKFMPLRHEIVAQPRVVGIWLSCHVADAADRAGVVGPV
eukprot:scaffold7804_cov65-Phaeocystis_antarctica.AAC.2